MTKITQAQLIESLNKLKDIKPRKEWAVLLKSQILAEKQIIAQPARFVGIMDAVRFLLAPRKLAYSFAVVLFLAVGIFGLNNLAPSGKVPPQTASLTNQADGVIKEQISVTVKSLTQSLKQNPVQSPEAMKVLAKTLASMPGDVASTQDAKDLTQIVVSSEIESLNKTTLTEEQNDILKQAEILVEQEKYSEALEAILLINQ